MREIKFRAWYGSKMYIVDTLGMNGLGINEHMCFAHKISNAFITNETNCVSLIGAKFMQYTGLKDKNGKEIYEGDIVRSIPFDEDKIHIRMYGDLECYWNNKSCCFQYNSFVPMNWGGIESYEIIGNIHENPELL